MNIDGEYTPIKELPVKQLASAINSLEHGKPSGGQESKIISLKKEMLRRKRHNKAVNDKFQKTYPAKKGKK